MVQPPVRPATAGTPGLRVLSGSSSVPGRAALPTTGARRKARIVASVAVIGVGRIGTALVQRLHGQGHRVSALDIQEARRTTIERAGARWSSDLADALRDAEFAVTALPGSPELRTLALEGTALRSGLTPGTTWIDLTSASPDLGAACADLARHHGVGHLDAPLAGGAEAVRAGRATLYVGGDGDTLERALPVLRACATTVHHVGRHGAGHLTKLLINLIWFGQVGLVTESLLLAQRHGLAPREVSSLLRGSAADSAFVARHLPTLLRGDYMGEFGLDRCVEELDAIEEVADAAGVPHPLTSAVAELHRAALRHYGRVDGELLGAGWLEHQSGTTLAEG